MSSFSASDVADIVIARLKPLLEDIRDRMPEQGELVAINKGVGATLELQAANAMKLERMETTLRNAADNHATLVDEVRGYHTRTIDSHDKLGARVHKLTERVERLENGETILVVKNGGE